MNASVLTSAVQAASSPVITTPISSIISAATPKTSMVQASSAASTTSALTENMVTTAEQVSSKMSEKMILGISQRNLVIGGAILGTAVVASGGFYMWKHYKSGEIKGTEIVLTATSTAKAGISVGIHDGSKLTKEQKKVSKEICSSMAGLDEEQIFKSIAAVAGSENPSFYGTDLRTFPGTNVSFTSVEDRIAFGVALVHQAILRRAGYPTVLEYSRGDDVLDRPKIRVLPVIKGNTVRDVNVIDVDAPAAQ